MGSSKILILESYSTMADGKKSLKNKLIKPFLALFQKSKKKEKVVNNKAENEKLHEVASSLQHNKPTDNEVMSPFDNLLKRLEQIEIDKKRILEAAPVTLDQVDDNDSDTDSVLREKFDKLEIDKKQHSQKDDDDDDELRNFSTITVTADKKGSRIDSETSEDSGYAEKGLESDDENKERDVEEGGTKPEKLQKVFLRRGPMKNKRTPHYRDTEPYSLDNGNQISQINPQSLSGGQVTINREQFVVPDLNDSPEQLHDVLAQQITEALTATEYETCIQIIQTMYPMDKTKPHTRAAEDSFYGPSFNDSNHFPASEQLNQDFSSPFYECNDNSNDLEHNPLTPPSSVHSHCLYSPQYARSMEMPSPGTSPRSLNSEGEHFGNLSNVDIPSFDSPQPTYKNLKQYKDRQKELMKEFSKKECCQLILKPCKEIFREQSEKLDVETRKGLALSVASMDLKSAYGFLKRALINLSMSNEAEDRTVVLFTLICERILSAERTLFVEDFGLSLLKIAVLCCQKRPVITRYLVQCIRLVTRGEAYKPAGKIVFSEVDANGDNLLIACVRNGDGHANVLRELLRRESNDVPLFDVEHVNTDGYTALHVCCAEHSASTPRAHTLHVLREHADADRRQKDRKGSETPLHLAVNSANCDLDFVLLYLHDNDRNVRYDLAHIENGSGKSPLEYAKFAQKSRPNYPKEILDFLKRCRK